MADLEYIIQTSPDKNEIDLAKDKMIKAQEAADLELEEIVQLDGLIQNFLQEKNI